MDRAAAEAFLAEPRITLLAADRSGKEPFLVAVWHEYRDGRFFDSEPDSSGVTIVVTPTAWRAADYAEGRQADHAPWIIDADFR
jgi:hypothetical protein